jgi:hypothetical protein
MELLKAIEVKKALFTISDLLEIEPQQLVNSICLLNKDRYAKIKEASDIWNTFDDADLVTRGSILGLNIKLHKKSKSK